MDNSKKIIEIIVIAICLGFLIYRFGTAGRTGGSGIIAAIEQMVSFDLESAKKQLREISKDNTKDSAYKEFRDLFAKPRTLASLEEEMLYGRQKPVITETEQPAEDLVLEGIIWGGKTNMAIISGKVVSEGDIVKDANVVRIYPDKVIVLQNGSHNELKR